MRSELTPLATLQQPFRVGRRVPPIPSSDRRFFHAVNDRCRTAHFIPSAARRFGGMVREESGDQTPSPQVAGEVRSPLRRAQVTRGVWGRLQSGWATLAVSNEEIA